MSLFSSIGKIFKKIVRPLASVVAPLLLPGPVGAVAGSLFLPGAISGRRPTPDFSVFDAGRATPAVNTQMARAGLFPSALPTVMRAGAGVVVGIIRTARGAISRIVLPSGQSFSRKKAAALIKRVGFEAAAIALGITVFEAAEILLAETTGRRRRRGITGAQLASAKRVNCTIKRMAADLGCGIKATPPRRRRAAACR